MGLRIKKFVIPTPYSPLTFPSCPASSPSPSSIIGAPCIAYTRSRAFSPPPSPLHGHYCPKFIPSPQSPFAAQRKHLSPEIWKTRAGSYARSREISTSHGGNDLLGFPSGRRRFAVLKQSLIPPNSMVKLLLPSLLLALLPHLVDFKKQPPPPLLYSPPSVLAVASVSAKDLMRLIERKTSFRIGAWERTNDRGPQSHRQTHPQTDR